MGRLFGTDGVRGIANEFLTAELAMEFGCATAAVLSGGSRRRPLIAVGMDSRLSSDMLAMSVAAGLCAVGADVLMLGMVPTPAVAYLVVKYKADAGIMISASHNPAEFNGIKIFSGDGHKLPDELEERIEDMTLNKELNAKRVAPVEIGKVTHLGERAIKDYIDHLKSTVAFSLNGLHIAIDCANGSASATAQRVFTDLGAECDMLSVTPDGLNINRDCGSTHIENLAKYVVEHNLDAGVAFDGDADRCICVDDQGNEIDGDMIMAICALDMKERGRLEKNAVVGTVMTNLGFVNFCEEHGITFYSTKVGDRYVMEKMLQDEYSFGGEASGHIIFRDFATTGDGELTGLQLLSLVARSGKKLSELAKCMTRYPQRMINVKVSPAGKLAIFTDPVIRRAIDDVKLELGKTGRVLVRPSGTEPLVRVMGEGSDMEQVESIVKRLADVITKQLAGL